jgi:dihydrofolate reductase
MKCSVFIATSLDGYIARADGSIDWLLAAHAKAAAGEDFGFQAFFASVDALVMGRKTLEQVLTFPDWQYGEKPIVAMSRTWRGLPDACPATVTLSDRSPKEVVATLYERGARHLYIDGGATIRGFLAARLIDELTITTIPIILGDGIRPFGPPAADVPLCHEETRPYACGFVQSKYRVIRP